MNFTSYGLYVIYSKSMLLDLKKDLVENMTNDEKTSIKEGLLLLLEILKDEEKDSLEPGNSSKTKQTNSRSFKDTEESIEEDAESGKGTGNTSKEITEPSKCTNL